MQHWLGDVKLDRFVFRALKETWHSNCETLTVRTRLLLREERLLHDGQVPPYEDDIYRALTRLIQRGKVEKYIGRTGDIRYRIEVYPRPI